MTNDIILYPDDNGTAIVIAPTGEIPTSEVARKDVPAGKPYLILTRDDLPENVWDFVQALEADFSNPDGIAIGQEAWFAEKGL